MPSDPTPFHRLQFGSLFELVEKRVQLLLDAVQRHLRLVHDRLETEQTRLDEVEVGGVGALGDDGLVRLVALDEAALGQFIPRLVADLVEHGVVVERLLDAQKTLFPDVLVSAPRSSAGRPPSGSR